MSKDFVAIIIGVIALGIAAGAFYEITTLDKQVLTKPGQINNTDYTSQINSLDSKVDSIINQINLLNSQVGSINGNQSVLNTLKSNVSDIQTKLVTLESKITQSQNPVSSSTQLSILLDKSSYLQSDTVKIVAVGANPQKPVQIQVLDSTGYVVLHKDTLSDSVGRVSLDLQLSSALTPGNYLVQIISDQQTKSQTITISSASSTPSSGSFTAQTDKTIYNVGNLVQVSGTASPSSSVTGVLTSPTGKTSTTTTTSNTDGSYTMYLFTSQPYETGAWSIAVTNLGQIKSLSIYIQSSGSTSGTTSLTAQTDKQTYYRGDFITLRGVGQPSTNVSAVLTSPTGQSTSINTNTDATGAYTMVFPTSTSSTVGNWTIIVTNLSQTQSLTLSLG